MKDNYMKVGSTKYVSGAELCPTTTILSTTPTPPKKERKKKKTHHGTLNQKSFLECFEYIQKENKALKNSLEFLWKFI